LCAALLSPLYTWLFTHNAVFLVLNLIVSAFLIWRHRSNIRKLIQGT
jgi:glycerol-3-phosphate acyltransferase PlsY